MVEAHSPQGEGSGQETHMCEQNSDRVLEAGEFLEDRRSLNQLPVRLRLLDLNKKMHKGSFVTKTGVLLFPSTGILLGIVSI